jgi:predicted DNA-binding transcriptional regulator AlpA
MSRHVEPRPVAQEQDQRRRRAVQLPAGLTPCALNREQSAAFVGLSPPSFDDAVKKSVFPQPHLFGRRQLWMQQELEEAVRALPRRGDEPGMPPSGNVWDLDQSGGKNGEDHAERRK